MYIGAFATALFAIAPSGTQKWKTEVGVGADQSFQVPAVVDGNGTVYTGTDEGTFAAIGADGTIAWKISMNQIITGAPSMGADGTIYVGTHDGKLHSIGEKN